MNTKRTDNKTRKAIAENIALTAVSLFLNGFGVFLTIRAGIGAAPWDVLNLGVSQTLGILYGSASITISLLMMVIGLFIMGYTQFMYMAAALGCGPRDTLMVGLAKRLKRIPIGAVSIAILSLATLSCWLLGGKVGIGTIICAFGAGPIMQFAFRTVRFDATTIHHQNLAETAQVLTENKS